jgi:hypothetical protein
MSLGENAVIRDLNIEVKNESPEDVLAAVHFGGIAGNVTKAVKIINVTVSGTLTFANTSAYVLLGGIIGETGASSGTIELENCVTHLNVELTNGTNGSNNTNGFGGLIGKAAGSIVSIKNCYTTGNIKVKNSANKRHEAGGLVADASNVQLKIENSYASGEVISRNDASSWGADKALYAGGLVGGYKDTSTVMIKNSVALNPKVLAVALNFQNDGGRAIFGRLVGGSPNPGANTLTVRNSIALKGMYTGKTETGEINNDTGDADTAPGLGKTLDELKQKSLWVDTLGWSESVWDFSGLSEGKWPTLK